MPYTHFKYDMKNNKIRYIIAAISEFASKFGLTFKQATNYLIRFKGLDFLEKHYEIEHQLSFNDCVDDMAAVCKQNGGAI